MNLIAEEKPDMTFYRACIRVVCTLAFVVLAGGQVLHACVDSACAKDQATEEHSSCPDSQDCPIGDCCLHVCSCLHLTMVDASEFLFLIAPSSSFVVSNETCDEGFCREIDYPPQLS